MKQYWFYVQIQIHVLAGLVNRGYVWYFGFYVVCFTSHTMPNIKKKQCLFANVVFVVLFVVLDCVQSFSLFPYKLFKNLADAPKTQAFLKKTLRLSKIVSLSCVLPFSLLLEVRKVNLNKILPVFVLLQCQVLPALVFESYVWYFGFSHLAFEKSCEIDYLKK